MQTSQIHGVHELHQNRTSLEDNNRIRELLLPSKLTVPTPTIETEGHHGQYLWWRWGHGRGWCCSRCIGCRLHVNIILNGCRVRIVHHAILRHVCGCRARRSVAMQHAAGTLESVRVHFTAATALATAAVGAPARRAIDHHLLKASNSKTLSVCQTDPNPTGDSNPKHVQGLRDKQASYLSCADSEDQSGISSPLGA
jgi:hypothetical protein